MISEVEIKEMQIKTDTICFCITGLQEWTG